MNAGWNKSNQKQINLYFNKGINRPANLNSYFSAINYIIKSVSYIHTMLNKMVNYSVEAELIFVESIHILLNRTAFSGIPMDVYNSE